MRPIWWVLLAASTLALAGAVATLVLVVIGDDESGGDTVAGECRPAPRSEPAGNADLVESVSGRRFDRTIVIRATAKESGEPLRGARVTVRAEMTCPHFMPLYEQRLRETAAGRYSGRYRLIMPGHWKFVVVARSKQGGATTFAFPLQIVG